MLSVFSVVKVLSSQPGHAQPATNGSGHNRQHRMAAKPRVPGRPVRLDGKSCIVEAYGTSKLRPAGFLEVGLEVRKILVSLAALAAVLYCCQPQARAQYTQPTVAPNSTLADVRYDWRWEVYGGVAYSHFNAGPNLIQGANLGGFDAQVARFFTPRWAIAGNARGYYGTSGVAPNHYGIEGPFVSETMFLAGPEYRGPSNQHVSMLFHALVGGAYGYFTRGLQDQNNNPVPPENVGFFNNQMTFASAIGGSIDLNRSPRLVFRVSPDATLTNFGGAGLHEQFALSVGLVYRFGEGLHPRRK